MDYHDVLIIIGRIYRSCNSAHCRTRRVFVIPLKIRNHCTLYGGPQEAIFYKIIWNNACMVPVIKRILRRLCCHLWQESKYIPKIVTFLFLLFIGVPCFLTQLSHIKSRILCWIWISITIFCQWHLPYVIVYIIHKSLDILDLIVRFILICRKIKLRRNQIQLCNIIQTSRTLWTQNLIIHIHMDIRISCSFYPLVEQHSHLPWIEHWQGTVSAKTLDDLHTVHPLQIILMKRSKFPIVRIPLVLISYWVGKIMIGIHQRS